MNVYFLILLVIAQLVEYCILRHNHIRIVLQIETLFIKNRLVMGKLIELTK
jgi:hypothetical protein